ncbi:MAG: MgtC/SapB family protein [Thermoplasmatota archaeon]
MSELDFLLRLALSLAIGGLIGLEREQHRDHELVIAGVRTFPLIALAGALFAFLQTELDLAEAVPLGLCIFAAVAVVYAWIRHSLRLTGLTSPVAVLVTYIIGVLIGYGLFVEGVAVGVATTFLLLAKGRLHAFAQAVTEAEMMGALQFILVAFVLYPITLDMGDVVVRGFNVSRVVSIPAVVLTVILVSLLSLASFLAVRYFGTRKGLAATGALGGLVNSEAATASLAHHARRNPALAGQALAGVLLANASMLVRNLAVSGLSDPSMKTALVMLPPVLVMAFMSGAFGLLSGRVGERARPRALRIESPFAMQPAVVLGALVAFLSAAVYFLAQSQSSGGAIAIYATALAGFVSSAAVAFSLSTLAFTGHLSPLTAGEVAVLACLVSTLNKLLVIRTSSKEMARSSRAALAAVLASGALSFLAVDIYLRALAG